MPVSQLCLHSGAGTAAKLCHLPATDHGAVSCANAQLCPVSARSLLPVRSACCVSPPAAANHYLHLDSNTPTHCCLSRHLGLAYTRTALRTQRHALSLSGLYSVSSTQLPVCVSVLGLVSLVLHSVTPTGASPVTVYTYSLCMYYISGTNTYVLRLH